MELLQIAFLLVVAMVQVVFVWRHTRSRPDVKLDDKKEKAVGPIMMPGTNIEPLPDFDWKTTPPLKLRPFKPTYNITMALQTSTPSSLILLDTNYLTRITARRALLTTHPRTVLGVLRPAGHAPVHELYTYLLGTYLPARYPTLFQVTTSRDPSTAPHTVRVGFRNCVTGRTAPLYPGLAGAEEMLTVLGETVEDDLFLLLPEGVGGGKGGAHRLVAFVCCHPSGFDPVEKLGKRLAGIHEPVPGYEKIAGSMERYFARLQVGKCVKRVNWSIQTHPHLFAPSGNHIHPGEEVEEEADIDIEKVRFRVELQSLMRLPKTGAILFSFKTYMYSLDEIKEEGLGPELADAIEGLKAGNAPGMWRYKGAVRWGTAVCEYLRAEGKNERPTLG